VAIARGNGRDFRFPEYAAATPADVAGVARNVDGFDSGTFRGRVYWKFLSAQWSAHTYQKHLPTAEYDTLFGDPRTMQTDTRDFVELRAEPHVSDTVSVLTRLHLVGTAAAYGNYAAHLISTLGSGTQADPLHYQNESSPLVVLGGEVGLRREFRQGAMFAVSYGVSVAHFLASNGFSDLASLRTAPDKRAVENSPVQMASLKAVIPIVNHALSAGSRLGIEGPRYDRYENSNDPNTQGKTAGSVLWDIVLSGDEPHYGVHYAFGMYNALDWRYSVPVSNEFTQRSIEQNGRSFLASVDVKY
jgi:hypothetical protein